MWLRTRDRHPDRHGQRDRMAPRMHLHGHHFGPSGTGPSGRCATPCCYRQETRSRSWPTTPATGSFTATCRSIPPAGWRPGFVSDEQLSPRPKRRPTAGRIPCSWIEEQRRGGNQHRLRGVSAGEAPGFRAERFGALHGEDAHLAVAFPGLARQAPHSKGFAALTQRGEAPAKGGWTGSCGHAGCSIRIIMWNERQHGRSRPPA